MNYVTLNLLCFLEGIFFGSMDTYQNYAAIVLVVLGKIAARIFHARTNPRTSMNGAQAKLPRVTNSIQYYS